MLNKKLKYLEVRFKTFAYTSMASKSFDNVFTKALNSYINIFSSLECSNSINVMISNYVLCF